MFYSVSSPWSPAFGVIEIPKIPVSLYRCVILISLITMFNFVVRAVCRTSADIVSAWKQQQTAVLIKLDNNLASQRGCQASLLKLYIYIYQRNFTKL